ncbi:hypothetical protein [Amycolatopsis jejuensis]|uniref:hypothetical protein n=1 Tax=Amycolatopsis jejuensis TaxID=330084 RepID=UPI0005275310|nr:hypothetical protein [Amycolatopsis jejuensis]
MASLAEERAAREGMPVVNCVLHELFTAAAGDPIVVSTVDGKPVLLRLATADEFIEQNAAALASLPEHLRPEPVTRARAEDLVKPFNIWSGGR